MAASNFAGYKKSASLWSRCGTNRHGHHAEPTNNSCCFGVYSKGACRCHKRSFCWKSRTCAWNVLVWHSFMAAVRRRHFWILLLWFVLACQSAAYRPQTPPVSARRLKGPLKRSWIYSIAAEDRGCYGERSHGSRQAGICWSGPLPS